MKSNFKVKRFHDISVGHRVVGHEGKCRHLHGHNYRIHFTCEARPHTESKEIGAHVDGIVELDSIGRVVDFGVIKEKLCMWLEDNWDHKFVHHKDDPLIALFTDALECDHISLTDSDIDDIVVPTMPSVQHGLESFVPVNFNPTAENMAQYLVEVIGPKQLAGSSVILTEVLIEETAKCHASYCKG